MAMKNKMDISIGVVIGSSTQIAVFTIPFITLLAWPMGKAFTLDFMMFQTFILLISVLIVNIVIFDGESNWLEGCVLLGSYLIIAMGFFYLPV
jgi:Ca2+:H+ antiporter